MAELARVVREEPGELVKLYEYRFFEAADLEFATEKERNLVKDHLLSRLREGAAGPTLLKATRGLSQYLNSAESGSMIDSLAQTMSYAAEESANAAAGRIADEYFGFVPAKLESRWMSRLQEWADLHTEKERPEDAKRFADLRGLLASVDDDIPF